MTHKIYLILINYSHHCILNSRETISHSQNKARVTDARRYLEWLPCHQYRYVGVCLAVEEDRCLFGYAGMEIFKTFIKLFIVLFPFLAVVFLYSGHKQAWNAYISPQVFFHDFEQILWLFKLLCFFVVVSRK
jgi:hypothetical protein